MHFFALGYLLFISEEIFDVYAKLTYVVSVQNALSKPIASNCQQR